MTTDSVGVIIPEVIKQFHLSMTAAGSFQYATMGGIALAGFFLGFLADRLGRKATIILGLTGFAVAAYLFAIGSSFAFFLALLAVSGLAIGVFKTGALALIGDIASSTTEHTSLMNTVEGFFGVGSIAGPALRVAVALRHCRHTVRAVDPHRGSDEVSGDKTDQGGTGKHFQLLSDGG
jgi:fucose permease